MTSDKHEGISAETVEAVENALRKIAVEKMHCAYSYAAQAAITALLASGEVAIVKKVDKDTSSISTEAADVMRGMVEFCINQCYCMGMDEGQNEAGEYHPFVKELLAFTETSGTVILRTDHEAELEKVRKSVAELVKFAESFHFTVTDSYYKDVYLGLHYPHSLTMRIPNDSTKSFIFADIEERRAKALSHFTTNHATTGETE